MLRPVTESADGLESLEVDFSYFVLELPDLVTLDGNEAIHLPELRMSNAHLTADGATMTCSTVDRLPKLIPLSRPQNLAEVEVLG